MSIRILILMLYNESTALLSFQCSYCCRNSKAVKRWLTLCAKGLQRAQMSLRATCEAVSWVIIEEQCCILEIYSVHLCHSTN